ncbi:MAG TPA: glycosyltransferase family 1 protein, partial [Acidimicrobiales bacterium]|nr:glycosyltransferase family 1 protein [Acidimicrobiales bacterium]
TVHDLSFEHHPRWMAPHDRVLFRTLVPRAVARAARVLTVSETTRQDIVERYRVLEDRVIVTHNGVDARFHPDGPRIPRDPFLLFVGALHPRKGLTTALEALALLPDAPPLVVVGPPKHGAPAVDAAIDRLGLRGRVELAGHVDDEQLACLYRSAEAFVFPSLFEGFGLPVVEAMASGTPVVTTTAGALPEVAGDAAVLVPPADSEALAAGIEAARRDHDALRTAGLANAARFRWDALAARTAEVYREVLG